MTILRNRYYSAFIGCLGALLLFSNFWAFSPLPAHAKPVSEDVFSIAPYLERFKKQITEFRLDNGMKFIILENRDAPVVSFITYADVGGANEPDGKTGVAHFLEHLAFKGTRTIGTIDYSAEKKALDRVDEIEQKLQEAKKSGKTAEINALTAQFQQAKAEADRYVRRNEYGQLVETQGGVGLNATTSSDATNYFYSFPSNKLELWMSLESERFLEPVLQREFYKEKDVILEERRMRTDNSPIGLLIEAFLDKAYTTTRPIISPWRSPGMWTPNR
jgi:predicted Zn-dependent peptidase